MTGADAVSVLDGVTRYLGDKVCRLSGKVAKAGTDAHLVDITSLERTRYLIDELMAVRALVCEVVARGDA